MILARQGTLRPDDALQVSATDSTGRRHHYPALDGLRGIAFLAVFLAHYYTMVAPGSSIAWGGWLGVDLFFVLSGFLITGILFDSLQQPHYFRTFYLRRTLRIFPLYYVTWVVFLLLTPWLHPLWTAFDIARVFYYGNLMDFYAARHPEIAAGGFMFFTPSGHFTGFNAGALWSLCLEEQFYLVWPLLIFFVKDRKGIMRICSIAILASLILNAGLSAWATHMHVNRAFLYDATYTHFSPLVFGAWLALWLRGRTPGKPVRAWVYLSLVFIPGILLFFLLAFAVGSFDLSHPLVPTLGYILSALTSTGLVLAVIQQNGFLKRIFSVRWLRSIGTISYGLYIFHGFMMGTFSHHLEAFSRHRLALLMPVVAFAAVFSMAFLSYRYFEQPFLRLKDRLAPTLPVSITGRDPLAQPRTTLA